MIEGLPEGTVTVLFTDVEGSTELRSRRGDDAAQEILRTHEQLLRERLGKHGGREVSFMGDGFMVAFGSTRKAIACAVEIQRTFAEHNRAQPERAIRVRMGLNTGEVVHEGGTLYGSAVNAAARISAKAQGGQILVSQVVKDLTGGVAELTFVDRGLFSLKGFPQRWRLYEVPWEPPDEDALVAPAPETIGAPVPGSSPAAPELVARPIEGTAPDGAPGVVGRATERAAIGEELEAARGGPVRVLALEGEAGIGKTRLLEEATAAAASRGYGVVVAGGDEELRGPFLLARTLFASRAMETLAEEAVARPALEEARDVLMGRIQLGTGGLSPQEQMLRVYDVATVAVRAVAAERPLALLLDDLQWADEDSLRFVRYLIRTSSTSPIFIMLAIRADAESAAAPASALVADLERMRLARRFRLARFTRVESQELLGRVLGAPVSSSTAATLHARGEGVPFFIVEFARAYREARLLQPMKGTWEIARTARQTVPSSVQILIERRLGGLPEESRAALADAAVLGRRFRLEDLERVTAGGRASDPLALAEDLAPAVAHSLVAEAPPGSGHDYAFTHDEIRSVLARGHSRQRRRAIHGAMLELAAARAGIDLEAPSEAASPAALATIAHHALESGDGERGIRYSKEAARAALRAHAPEEAIRLVDAARPAASSPQDRAELLRLRDDALAVLGRGEERPPILAELAALATALGDPGVELEVTLRRASAARLTEDFEQAADLARRALHAAEERADREAELGAALELGQALLQSTIGEGFGPPPREVDLDGAEEAYRRAERLAEDLRDARRLAAARRELGVVEDGRAIGRVYELVEQGMTSDPRKDPELLSHVDRARELLDAATRSYEEVGDHRGAMSCLIATAYSHIVDETQHGHAGRIEQIRRLRQNLGRLTSESERALGELHMLFSIQVYGHFHGHADLALARGAEAYGAARAQGHRLFEFLSAAWMARTHVQMAEIRDAEAWLERAEEAVLASPDPLPQRELETVRGLVRSAEGEGQGMREHLEVALAAAGTPAARCEIQAALASEAARLGADLSDEDLLGAAERAAEETLRLVEALPGNLPWEVQAHAALAQVALARDDADRAAERAGAAMAAIQMLGGAFPPLHLDVMLACARVLAPQEGPQAELFRGMVRLLLQEAVSSIADEAVRDRWLGGPIQRELVELIGGLEGPTPWGPKGITVDRGAGLPAGLTDEEAAILRALTAGKTEHEIAEGLRVPDEQVAGQVAALLEKIGAGSADEAARFAVKEGVA